MPKSKISKPEVKQPRVVLRSSAAEILSAYDKHIYSVEQALQMLGVSRPTFFRRLKAWRDTGRVPPHGNNGHTPSNKISDETRQRVIQLVQTKYPDFQASLLTKYLREQEDIHVSVEWVRRLLLELHPEQTPKERRRAAHTLRRRRASRGELVQIDGSPHFWFPGDAERRTLIAFIDDATSELLSAYFSPTEDTEAYVNALEYELVHNGIPMAIYSDRHSVFTSNVDEARRKSKPQPTQFQKICDHLGIELILAHSPEAKGRVERLFQTLQKRWPKEFRILGIHNLAEANERMPELIEAYNREFAITPADSKDSHIRLNEDDIASLDVVLANWQTRVVSTNLTVSCGKEILQIIGLDSTIRYAMKKTDIEVVTFKDGHVELYWCDQVRWEEECRREGRKVQKTYRPVMFKSHERYDKKPQIANAVEESGETSKTIDARVSKIAAQRPSPWKSTMTTWANQGIEKREKKEAQLQADKELEDKLNAARNK